MTDASKESELDEQHAVCRLLPRLKRSSPVRYIATNLLQQPPLTEPIQDIEPLLDLLDAVSDPFDHNWKERTVAAWALAQIPLAPKLQQLIAWKLGQALIDRAPTEPRTVSRLSQYFNRSLCLTVPPVAYDLFILTHKIDDDFDHTLSYLIILFLVSLLFAGIVTVLLIPVLGPLSLSLDRCRADKARLAAAQALGKLGLPLSIGVLAQGARGHGKQVRLAAIEALGKILPTVQSSHYGCFRPSPVLDLCRLLSYPDDAFVVKVLEALGKIGDGRAVRPVELLTKTQLITPVSEAAARILPILQERLRLEQDPQMLLRPANETSTPETLLRMATSPSESIQPQQLLRATMHRTTSSD